MEQIVLVYGHLKETVTTIMMFYKNMKAMIRSSDGDTDFFNIVTAVLTWDTLAPYLIIIGLDYVNWTSITLKKKEVDNIPLKLC